MRRSWMNRIQIRAPMRWLQRNAEVEAKQEEQTAVNESACCDLAQENGYQFMDDF